MRRILIAAALMLSVAAPALAGNPDGMPSFTFMVGGGFGSQSQEYTIQSVPTPLTLSYKQKLSGVSPSLELRVPRGDDITLIFSVSYASAWNEQEQYSQNNGHGHTVSGAVGFRFYFKDWKSLSGY